MRCLLLYHITSNSTNTVFLYSSRDDIRIVSLWLSCFGRRQDKTLALLTRRAGTRGFASSLRPCLPHYTPSKSPTSHCETYSSSLCEIKSVTPLYRSNTGSQVGSQHTCRMAARRCTAPSHGGRKALQRHHLFFFLLYMISLTLLNDDIMCFMASVPSLQPLIVINWRIVKGRTLLSLIN
jgi:hypothetical protein